MRLLAAPVPVLAVFAAVSLSLAGCSVTHTKNAGHSGVSIQYHTVESHSSKPTTTPESIDVGKAVAITEMGKRQGSLHETSQAEHIANVYDSALSGAKQHPSANAGMPEKSLVHHGTPQGSYDCVTDYRLPAARSTGRKGICVDDATMKACPGAVPSTWPNTENEGVTSLRLFKPWHHTWGGEDARKRASLLLVSWAKANHARILMGQQVTCDYDGDREMWQWNLELMKLLGQEHIMGVAIGNELDLFQEMGKEGLEDAHCNNDLWGGDLWKFMQECVEDMDRAGFGGVKVTSVWALNVLGSNPSKFSFKEDADAKVNTLLTNAFKKWGKRWVWTFNTYAAFDRSLWPTSEEDCDLMIGVASSLTPVKGALMELRKRIRRITGNDDDAIWIGETGWSSFAPEILHKTLSFCPGFWSPETFRKAYKNFMHWDLSLDMGFKGPEHAFYFSLRDSWNHGKAEGFGLIKSCVDRTCKLQNGGADHTGIFT